MWSTRATGIRSSKTMETIIIISTEVELAMLKERGGKNKKGEMQGIEL